MTLSTAAALRKDKTDAVSGMEHRHFATVAAIIANMPTVHNGEQGFVDVRQDVAYHFANGLARTNPRFDRARFLTACGVK